jgi:isopentenyl diphosphate isomerase/L-lactate dehydrogenase-like FMN-dependent dehydrogenase
MIVAMDYDDTFDKDPVMWGNCMTLMKAAGHTVLCVTMRYDTEEERIGMDVPVFYTGRRAKRAFMQRANIFVDVWIDDNPEFVHFDASIDGTAKTGARNR